MSVLNPFTQDVYPTRIRRDYAVSDWAHRTPTLNPTDTFMNSLSSDPSEQLLHPVEGRVLNGRLYDNDDPFVYRAMTGTEATAPALKARLMVERNSCLERYGSKSSQVAYKDLLVANFDNRPERVTQIHGE